MIETIEKLVQLLDELEAAHIFFRLHRNRTDGICIAVDIPGQRWEIDVLDNGRVDIEIFRSDGEIFDEAKLEELFREWRD